MSRLEQLLYTSAEDGLDGQPGFQVVAATAGLASRGTSLAAAALRLCRYEPPARVTSPDEAPISYGWIDAHSTRLVFHRTYAGLDGWGRPGNFYAHVLAGPAAALPVGALLRRYGSTFWWHGQALESLAEGRRLPEITIAEVPEGTLPEAPDEDVARLIEAVLAAGGTSRIAFRAQPARIMAVVAAAASALPGLLERFSLSTYEGEETAGWFDLVGVGSGGAQPPGAIVLGDRSGEPPAPAVRRVAELAMSNRPQDRRAVDIAVESATSQDRSVDVGVLVAVADTIDRISAGDRVDVARLLPALSKPSSAEAVLGPAASRAAVVGAAVDGPPELWSALGVSAAALDADVLATFGDELGRHVIAHRPDMVGAVVNAMAALPTAFRDACTATILAVAAKDPSPLDKLDSGAKWTLLQHRRRRPSGPVVQALLAVDDDEIRASILDDLKLPRTWRARVLADMTCWPGSDPRTVAWRLSEDPKLIRPLAAAVGRAAPLLAVLGHLDPAQAASLSIQAADKLHHDARFELLTDVLDRLPVEARPSFLARCVIPQAAGIDPRWASLVVATVREAARGALDRTNLNPVPGADLASLLQAVDGTDAQAWTRFLKDLHSATEAPPLSDELHQALWDLRRHGRGRDSAVAAELALTIRVHVPLDLIALEQLVRQVSVFFYPARDTVATAATVLRAGTRNLRLGHSRRSAATCVQYIGLRVARGELAVRRNGALADASLQQLAASIVVGLHPQMWSSYGDRISVMGRAAHRWRLSLPGSQRPGIQQGDRGMLPQLRRALALGRRWVSRM